MKRNLLIVVLAFCASTFMQAQEADYRDSIAALVTKYLYTDDIDGRLTMVMTPERVRPFMEQAYEDGIETKRVVKDDLTFQRRRENVYFVTFKTDRFSKMEIYVIKTASGYKIDWEATNKWNKVSVDDVITVADGTVLQLRGFLGEVSGYENKEYNGYNFSEESLSLKVKIIYTVKKDSEIDKYIRRALAKTRNIDTPITLKVRKSGSEVEDDGYRQKTYYYFDILDIVSKDLSTY